MSTYAPPLPYSRLVRVCEGLSAVSGQRETERQGDIGYTAAGCPVFVFNYEPWASLWFVSVRHGGECRRAWVYGSPERLVSFARDVLRLPVTVDEFSAIDETLPAWEAA